MVNECEGTAIAQTEKKKEHSISELRDNFILFNIHINEVPTKGWAIEKIFDKLTVIGLEIQ